MSLLQPNLIFFICAFPFLRTLSDNSVVDGFSFGPAAAVKRISKNGSKEVFKKYLHVRSRLHVRLRSHCDGIFGEDDNTTTRTRKPNSKSCNPDKVGNMVNTIASNQNEYESTRTINDIYNTNSLTDKSEWGMRQDWTLEDLVPRYTISTYHYHHQQCYTTFWNQLRNSSPILASYNEQELEERYQELFLLNKLKNSEHNSSPLPSGKDRVSVGGHTTKANQTGEVLTKKLLQQSGPSPILLSDWWISSSPTNALFISGKLPNGSSIWFPIQCVGSLEDDGHAPFFPFDETATQYQGSSNVMDPSYVESIQGVIYELGIPSRQRQQQRLTQHCNDDGDDTSVLRCTQTQRSHTMDLWPKNTKSLISNTLSIVCAFLATSILSAYLTFGFILGNTSWQEQFASSSPQTQMTTSTCGSKQMQNASGNDNHINSCIPATTSSIPFADSREEWTISELRARQELKVARDKRSLGHIQDRLQEQDGIKLVELQNRLHQDEIKLSELQREEGRLEAKYWGF